MRYLRRVFEHAGPLPHQQQDQTQVMAKKTTEYRWQIYRLRGRPATFVGAVGA